VELMVRAQKKMLQRFEKTNEMLSNVNTNSLSVTRLAMAEQDFKDHTECGGDEEGPGDNFQENQEDQGEAG
jgi:hypothetical protein